MSRARIGPADVTMCQLYDCYTYTVLVTLEDYGFCAKGEGGPFAASGALAPGGPLPVNTGGGQLSGYYMWGFTPLSEAIIQARGDGGDRQSPATDVILVSGNGGILSHHGTLIVSPHRRERPGRRDGEPGRAPWWPRGCRSGGSGRSGLRARRRRGVAGRPGRRRPGRSRGGRGRACRRALRAVLRGRCRERAHDQALRRLRAVAGAHGERMSGLRRRRRARLGARLRPRHTGQLVRRTPARRRPIVRTRSGRARRGPVDAGRAPAG